MQSNWLEQLAGLIVLSVIGIGGVMIKWLLGERAKLQKRIESQAMLKLQKGAMDAFKSKSGNMSGLVDEINRRTREERGE